MKTVMNVKNRSDQDTQLRTKIHYSSKLFFSSLSLFFFLMSFPAFYFTKKFINKEIKCCFEERESFHRHVSIDIYCETIDLDLVMMMKLFEMDIRRS